LTLKSLVIISAYSFQFCSYSLGRPIMYQDTESNIDFPDSAYL